MHLLEAKCVGGSEQSRVAEGAREMGEGVEHGFTVSRLKCRDDDREAFSKIREITQFKLVFAFAFALSCEGNQCGQCAVAVARLREQNQYVSIDFKA